MATEAEIIASNILASAIEYKRLYDTTKKNEYKVKEQRLRQIAENIKLIVSSTSSSSVSSFNGRTGAVILSSADVTGALGYTPGDMLKSIYDYDNDGVVDSAERTEIIVRNSTGSTLTKGTVVYLSGATGNRPNALRAQANSEATSSKTFGFVVSDIADNSDGYVACAGTLHDLDTSAFADGVALWLSPSVAGGWTTTVPSEPNHSVFLGYVARSHPTQGRVVILIQNGYELNELHDVVISSPSNGQILRYNSTNAYWENWTPTYLTAVPTLDQVTTAGNTTSNTIIYSGTTEAIRPSVDSTGALGASNYRWLNVYTRGVNSGANSLDILGTNINLNDNSGNIKLRVFGSTGNVVIQNGGTFTDAGYRLDVQGNTRVNGGNTSADIPFIINNRFQFKGDGALVYGNSAGHGRLTWDNSGAYFTGLSGYGVGIGANGVLNHLFINTSGNVGIGTTNPTYKVDVQGTTLATSSVRAQGSFDINPLAAPPVIGGYTLSAGTNLGVGTYYYFVVYVTALGETSAGANLTVVTTTGNTTVNLTGIPVSSDPRVTARKLYRTKLGGTSDNQWFLATISDNVTTTYTDSATDASLTGVGVQYYKVNTTARYFTVSGVQGMVIDNNLTALGRSAGNAIITSNAAAVRTVLIGAFAGQSITTGSGNVIVGQAGANVNTGSSNTLMGDLAGYNINSGSSNSILGAQSGRFLTIGGSNLILGAFSGRTLADGTTQFTSGNNNVIVGPDIRMSTITDSNSIVIGWDARGLGTNTTVIGNSSTTFTSIPAGNMTVGGTVNAGYKLDVNGTARIQGTTTITPAANTSAIVSTGYSVTGSGTTPLIDLSGTWNTTGTPTLIKANVTATATGGLSSVKLIDLQIGGSSCFSVNGFGGVTAPLSFSAGTTTSLRNITFGGTASENTFSASSNIQPTAGTRNIYFSSIAFTPTSGTATLTNFIVAGSINQTGGANGITRGLYVNPTLTAAADWRSIEWSNNSGWGLYGVGTGLNYLNGALLIGTTTNAGYKLDVNGTARIQSDLTVDTDTLFVDATNNRVGIGTTTPGDKLSIVDGANANIFGRITANGTNASAAWVAQNDQVDNVVYRVFGSAVTGSQMGISLARSASLMANLGGSGKFLLGTYSATDFVMGTGNAEKVRIVDSTGNFLIGTTSDNGNKLQVNGTIDGQAFAVNGVNGWTGTIMIATNPPGMQNIDVQGGIIMNVF